ncbi:hypothetical protein [Ureibacillus acetophenoni]|uniref:Uncharacterized protein n=1 Tax=Ureibacillus acetophenoni TaxID=614649 RepID=A0A285U635_9BACL|nr:hypothetical protein [Ureibacillus acetophenoni]SOC37404.1 hypothetical protein SAMN05877842_103189 [Ureibacillus acetophenoni]
MKHFLFITFILLLTACTNVQNHSSEQSDPQVITSSETKNEDKTNEPNVANEQEAVDEDIDYTKFFMPNESTAYFLGEGNEFATFTIHTKWLSERYVALVENNGGAVTLKIYRVMDEYNKIDKVYDQVIEELPNNVEYPSISELDSLPMLETYLTGPIEVGTVINGWEIVQVDVTLDTPYQTFDHVFVLEETSEDFINRKYFALGYGEVKRESIMKIDGEEDFVVTSVLEKIETAK